jgi:hypothetical protein
LKGFPHKTCVLCSALFVDRLHYSPVVCVTITPGWFLPFGINFSPFVGDSLWNEFFQPSTVIPFGINFSPFVSDSLWNLFFYHSSVFHPSSAIPFRINYSPFIVDWGLVFYPFGINFSPFVDDSGLFFVLNCSPCVGDSLRNQFSPFAADLGCLLPFGVSFSPFVSDSIRNQFSSLRRWLGVAFYR